MAATVTLTSNMILRSVETLTAAEVEAAPDAGGRQLLTGGFGLSQSLTGSTTPSVDEAPLVQQVTISGTTTIDFSAAPQQAGRTTDMDGKKVIAFIFKPANDNTGAITIAPGAANPYPLFGTGNSVELQKGQVLMCQINAIASPMPAVSSTVKTLDITGTASDTMDVEIHFGT